MSYITGRYNPSGVVITEGLRMFLDSTEPMKVNWTSGILRSNQTFSDYIDGGITSALTAATAGTQKISILEVKTDGTDVKILDGSEVGSLTADLTGAGYNGATTYRAFRIGNGTGSAITLSRFDVRVNNGSADEYYDVGIYGDNGSNEPDISGGVLADLGSVHIVAGTSPTFGGEAYLLYEPITDIGYEIADGTTVWVVTTCTSGASGGYSHAWYPSANDITYGTLKSSDASTWVAGFSSLSYSNSLHMEFLTGGALAAPAAESGYVAIAQIGNTDVPIDENTDEITEGAPTGTQVQIVYNDDNLRS